jgi:hypothetical protein
VHADDAPGGREQLDLPLRLHEIEHLDVEGILGSWINPVVKE